MSGNGVAARNSVPEPWPTRRSLRPLAVPLATFTVAAARVSALKAPTPSLQRARSTSFQSPPSIGGRSRSNVTANCLASA